MSREHVETAPILIAGHSHCRCLGVPIRTNDNVSRIVPNAAGDDRFVGFAGTWPLGRAFFRDLAAVSAGRTVALAWRGNSHVTGFALVAGPRIDFVLREDPELPLDADAELVADLVVHERLLSGRASLESVIAELRARGAARVLVLGTPPPKGEMEARRHRQNADTSNFRKAAARLGLDWDRLTFASPAFMYKAWRVTQRHLLAAAAQAGAEYVPVPAAALDGQILRAEYADDDWTHANAAYGRLMRDHLYEHVMTP